MYCRLLGREVQVKLKGVRAHANFSSCSRAQQPICSTPRASSWPHPPKTMSVKSLSFCLLFLPAGAALAQAPDLSRAPLLPSFALTTSESSPTSAPLPNRIRLFRMQPGFVSELPWLESDDRSPEAESDPNPDWISVAMG